MNSPGTRTSGDVQRAMLEQIRSSSDLSLLNEVMLESFFVADLAEVRRQYTAWRTNLDRVTPFYAVKCNPDARLIEYLASLDRSLGFDCASVYEIEHVLSLGISPTRIIFAAPVKSRACLVFAAANSIRTMTFDNLDELHQIAKHASRASLVLRIEAKDPDCTIDLSAKFGALMGQTRRLLSYARDLGLAVEGVAFHVGTGAQNGSPYAAAIRNCMTVISEAKDCGHCISLVDIGGGFSKQSFHGICPAIRTALHDYIPDDVRVIGEPGRYFAASAYTLAP